MSELNYDLPADMLDGQLRYKDPQGYELYIRTKGWTAELFRNVDNNAYKVAYRLSRPVNLEFNLSQLEALAKQMSIVNEAGDYLPGYNLRVDSLKQTSEVARKLVFEFTGFPTELTMNAMEKLEEAFAPPKEKIGTKWLGKLGLRRN